MFRQAIQILHGFTLNKATGFACLRSVNPNLTSRFQQVLAFDHPREIYRDSRASSTLLTRVPFGTISKATFSVLHSEVGSRFSNRRTRRCCLCGDRQSPRLIKFPYFPSNFLSSQSSIFRWSSSFALLTWVNNHTYRGGSDVRFFAP